MCQSRIANHPPSQVPNVKHAVVPQVSIQWGGFNPPPRARRLQGDLGYLDVQFVGSGAHQVTCTPTGFFVNLSKSKSELNPSAASKPCHSETLMGLLIQLNPKFKDKAWDLLRARASLHPFETGPLVVPNFPDWMETQESRVLPNGLSVVRSGEGSPAVTDYHTPMRTWNEEIQLALELPRGTYDQRLHREKTLSRLHSEFIDFATRAAMTAADGHMVPVNPHDTPEAWVYSVNNLFISQAADSRQTYDSIGGDEAARVLTKHDLHGIAAVRKTGTPLSTVSTAVVDYKGRRMVCQSLVPGILLQRVDGRGCSPQVQGLSEEDEGSYLVDDVAQEEFARLGKALAMRSHTMRDEHANEMAIHLSTEVKAMRASDDRHYLLDCSKLTPRDLNYPENKLAFVRFELKEDFVKSKRTGARYAALKERAAKAMRAVRESSLRRVLQGAALELPQQHPSHPLYAGNLHKIIIEVEEALVDEALLENEEAGDGGPPVALNCDLFSFTGGMEFAGGAEEEAVRAGDEEVLQEVAAFLRQRVEAVAAELSKLEVIDTECLRTVFHDHGVNMRYLGAVHALLPEAHHGLRRLLATEMVSRAVKHRLRNVMLQHALEDLASPVAAELSALLSTKRPSGGGGGGGGDGLSASAKKRAKKKNKKKKKESGENGSGDAAAAAAAAVSAAQEGEQEEEKEKEKESPQPPSDSADWVIKEVWSRFGHRLGGNYMNDEIVSRFALLRAVCLKSGLCLRQRSYNFREATPVAADDILDLFPVLHHHPPHYSVLETLLEKSHNEELEVLARRLHNALNHANQTVGAVCSETALCYQAIAKVLLALHDVDSAIQDQCKAVITTRRVHGATHGNMAPLLKIMGVLAHLSGRPQAAHQYLLRSVYLSRLLCGDVSLETLLTLVSFYHETYHLDRALHVLAHATKRADELKEMESLAACHQHHAIIVGTQGDPDKAVESQRRALEIYQTVAGANDPNTIDAEGWYVRALLCVCAFLCCCCCFCTRTHAHHRYRYWVSNAVERRKKSEGGGPDPSGRAATAKWVERSDRFQLSRSPLSGGHFGASKRSEE